MARDRAVNAIDGSRVALEVETICVHGDTPGAAVLASRIRKALIDAGVSVLPVGAMRAASVRAHGFRHEHTPQNLSHHRLRQLGTELDVGRNFVGRQPLSTVRADLVRRRSPWPHRA